MPGINEYRTKFEAIKQRLAGSNVEGNEDIRKLKERHETVRDSLQRKQEIIDSQKGEIEALREENEQLSELLGQAVAALEAQSQSGIKKIIQSIDTEFADLLAVGDAAVAPDGQAEGQDSDRREPASKEVGSQPAPSEGAKWDPEKESLPVLQRIMGRGYFEPVTTDPTLEAFLNFVRSKSANYGSPTSS